MLLQPTSTDLLVDATLAGTEYRRILCYDVANMNSMKSLKARVLDDLKVLGAPLDNACEVVLRNYILTDYERTTFNSAASKSCALSDEDSWSAGPGKGCRLLAAAPCPQVPIGPANNSRHAMLAIASRQFYDRSCGGGSVLPLEARVKPQAAAQAANAPEGAAADAAGATSAADPPALDPSLAETAPASSGRSGIELQPFDITVRDFRGRCHTARVCGGMGVARLKTGIAVALGCSVYNHWRLFYDGRPLDDDLDLADYSISAGALVEVQMTSQQHRQQANLKGGVGISPAPSGEAKDVFGGGGGAANGGGMGVAKTAAPNCSAARAIPVVRGAAVTQMEVQVRLPCGTILTVNRNAAEEVSKFVKRVSEAEKALLAPRVPPQAALDPRSGPPATRPETSAETSPRSPPAALRGLLTGSGELLGSVSLGALAPGAKWRRQESPLGGPPLCVAELSAERSIGRQQHKGAVIGQKLLAVLLAAAAMVMAMAVL